MRNLILISFLATPFLLANEAEPVSPITTEMAAATNAFLSSLDEAQKNKATFPFASEQREAWGFVPRERKGLPLEELDEKQTALVRTLLKTALSDPGLSKVDTVIALEAFLGEIEKRPDFRNPRAYFTSIFGESSATGTWGWRFEGHHLSLNYTVAEGRTVTPSFFAANPGEIVIDHEMRGTRPFHAVWRDSANDFIRDLLGDHVGHEH
jgi:hypothetical protein